MIKVVKKVRYSEGDAFAVPLDNGSFSMGVVGRKPKYSRQLILGIFFGATFPQPPGLAQLPVLEAGDTLLVCKCHDFGVTTGRWPLIGKIKGFTRKSWPMPKFLAGRRLNTYSDDNLNDIISTELAPTESKRLPTEEVMNARFVEKRLLRFIDPAYVPETAITIAQQSVGIFDDDDFQDFLGTFDEAPSRRSLSSALSLAAEAPVDEYLELAACESAIAASIIIAAKNSPFREALLERPKVISFVSRLNTGDIQQFARLGVRAIERILAASELKELWEEAEPFERDLRFKQLQELCDTLIAFSA